MGFHLITGIVQRGKAEKVVKAAMEAGAQGATVFYARGTGVRQKLGFVGKLIQPEKCDRRFGYSKSIQGYSRSR